VAEFGQFVAETQYKTDAERGKGCYVLNAKGDGSVQRSDANWNNPGFTQTPDHPVVCVSHNDAQQYARWLSLRTSSEYRLPTEAEWEYAARGGTTTTRFWGDGADSACLYANGLDKSFKARYPDSPWTQAACDDGAVFTAPAGSYRRNPFGLSDMLGNAWEWVEDCWHGSYEKAPAGGSAWLQTSGGDCARRVLRGGGWLNRPRYLRSANRVRSPADGAGDLVGIRLARTL
jgi:formylglycine-generating enzyme required for sulfatase activity